MDGEGGDSEMETSNHKIEIEVVYGEGKFRTGDVRIGFIVRISVDKTAVIREAAALDKYGDRKRCSLNVYIFLLLKGRCMTQC